MQCLLSTVVAIVAIVFLIGFGIWIVDTVVQCLLGIGKLLGKNDKRIEYIFLALMGGGTGMVLLFVILASISAPSSSSIDQACRGWYQFNYQGCANTYWQGFYDRTIPTVLQVALVVGGPIGAFIGWKVGEWFDQN
jgi:hypothetical protein